MPLIPKSIITNTVKTVI